MESKLYDAIEKMNHHHHGPNSPAAVKAFCLAIEVHIDEKIKEAIAKTDEESEDGK